MAVYASRYIDGELSRLHVPPVSGRSVPISHLLNFHSDGYEQAKAITKIAAELEQVTVIEPEPVTKAVKISKNKERPAASSDPIGYYVMNVDESKINDSSGKNSYKIAELKSLAAILSISLTGTKVKKDMVKRFHDWSSDEVRARAIAERRAELANH